MKRSCCATLLMWFFLSHTGCRTVNSMGRSGTYDYPYHHEDLQLRTVSVTVGQLEAKDQWLGEYQVFAWLVPPIPHKTLTNYLQLLIVPRQGIQATAHPQRGEFALFFSETDYKPLTIDGTTLECGAGHGFLQILLDLGTGEVGTDCADNLVLESVGSDESWPWRRRYRSGAGAQQ